MLQQSWFCKLTQCAACQWCVENLAICEFRGEMRCLAIFRLTGSLKAGRVLALAGFHDGK
jgi:hypothetical protein